MGVCLSCLRPDEENDDEYNERTSLLRNGGLYSDENLQEEILKQQQRQQELNSIVNDLSDNLIDVSTFLNKQTSTNNNSVLATPNLSYLTHSLNPQPSNDDLSVQLTSATTKSYPHVLTNDDKLAILKEIENMDASVKSVTKVKSSEPLYLQF